MNNSISTQGASTDLKDALDQMAENLKAHAGASLSKAHGIQLVKGYVDSSGNDLRVYADSNGDIVSNSSTSAPNFIQFTIGGVNYYAPAQTSALAGHASAEQTIADAARATSENQGSAALITDYATLETLHASSLNAQVLEHAGRAHAAVHQNLSAVVKTTVDGAGHTVGNYVVRLSIAGAVYDIPADLRLGGPAQVVRGITVTPARQLVSGSTLPLGPCSMLAAYTGGTLPATRVWQYNTLRNETGAWTDIPTSPSSGAINTEGGTFTFGYSGSDTAILAISANSLNGIDNATVAPAFVFRAKYTNAAGVAYSNVAYVDAYDKTSSSIIFSSSYAAGFMTKEQFFDMLAYRIRVQAHDRFGRATWAGYMLLFYNLALRIRQGDALARWLYWIFPYPFWRYAQWRRGKLPFSAGCWVLAKVYEMASLCAYCVAPKLAQRLAESAEQRGVFRTYVNKTVRRSPR